MHFLCPLLPDQRLDLCKLNPSDSDAVRGQIVGESGHADTVSVQMTPAVSRPMSLFCHHVRIVLSRAVTLSSL